MVLVIALTGVDVDEMLLDASFDAGRHIIIDGREPDRHTDGLIVAIHRTAVMLHLGIVEVDAMREGPVRWDIVGKDAAETVLAKRTGHSVAYAIGRCLLSKDGLSGLGGVVVLIHIILQRISLIVRIRLQR